MCAYIFRLLVVGDGLPIRKKKVQFDCSIIMSTIASIRSSRRFCDCDRAQSKRMTVVERCNAPDTTEIVEELPEKRHRKIAMKPKRWNSPKTARH